MPDYVGGSAVAEQRFRDMLLSVVDRLQRRNRRTTVATLIGGVRTKTFPDNPIAGEPVSTIFVATVRLTEFSDQPVVRDALVVNQARQLIAGDDADGTPVTVEISSSGTVTVIGRAAYSSPFKGVSYYTLDNLNGNQVEFVVGLRLKNTADLDSTLLANLNVWRTGKGLVSFGTGDFYFEDPQVDFHGEQYYIGYIGATDGGRFLTSIAGLQCSTSMVMRDFYATVGTTGGGVTDWFYASIGDVVDFSAPDAWYAFRIVTTCA